MSPRKKRHARKKRSRPQERIAWLEHRQGYPSEEERKAIIMWRTRLHMELMELMLLGKGPDTPEGKALLERYGWDEVNRLLKAMDSRSYEPILVGSAVREYREYRRRYARFGGERPFFSRQDYERLLEEHSVLSVKDLRAALDGKAERFADADREKQNELSDLLLFGEMYWEDLVPSQPPPRPQDYDAPPRGKYPPRLARLLEWGSDLSLERVLHAAQERERWRGYIGDLTRMVLDPGLLEGWPGEAASWAPWHALYLLSAIGAWESALALADLADRPNDWLSDCLPEVWGGMGRQVEPLLWTLVDDVTRSQYCRSLGVYGLLLLLDDVPFFYRKVGGEIVARLESSPQDVKLLNASFVHVLALLQYEEALPVIEKAFDDSKVDEDIIAPEDIEEFFDEEGELDEEDGG